MQEGIDAINYELNGAIIDKYGIKVKKYEDEPFAPETNAEINELVAMGESLLKSEVGHGSTIASQLEHLKDYVVKHSTKIQIAPNYHKYLLHFKHINIKEAIIFELLR
jgi:hypothetical protein